MINDRSDTETIEILAREKLEGKSYGEIRTALREKGLNEEEIRRLIRRVDERVLEETLRGRQADRTRQWYRGGLGLAVTGLGISVAFNAGWILAGWPAWMVYAPFLAGIALMFYSKSFLGKNKKDAEKGPGPIRRNRPYK